LIIKEISAVGYRGGNPDSEKSAPDEDDRAENLRTAKRGRSMGCLVDDAADLML
jgi:hypothetical protein